LRNAHAVSDMCISTLSWIERGRDGEPAAQAHCRCRSPSESTAGERDGRSAASVTCSWLQSLAIAVSSTTNLEIDMSKPRLLLIHCSNGVRPGAKHRQRGRSFRPLVIHGGARARSVPRESSWEAALELINLGFLISHGNYLAFLQASITVLEAYNRTDPEKTS
jgi:hypothetical protein